MLTIKDLQTPLVGPVSLTVRSGECCSIMGPSGSGKSLLLRAIADLDPNEGEVFLNDQSRNQMPAPQWRNRVALVPAESGWWADSVADHFDPKHDVSDLLTAVGLPDALDWNVSRLSSGERHRLAITRALACKPAVILLDEPTATLDGAATAQVETLIKVQCANGVAVLIVTHDSTQPGRVSARRFTLSDRQLHADGEDRV